MKHTCKPLLHLKESKESSGMLKHLKQFSLPIWCSNKEIHERRLVFLSAPFLLVVQHWLPEIKDQGGDMRL